MHELANKIKAYGQQLGFSQIGISDIDLTQAQRRLKTWLEKKYHGEMAYMERYGQMRSQPDKFIPGTLRVITARMEYLPPNAAIEKTLQQPKLGFISRYALGRDYHKLIRKRLQKLCQHIQTDIKKFDYRCFADSAPVMEKPLAQKAGLGWIGKHTNLINSKAGSYFFIGSIYTNLELPIDKEADEHCGSCFACKDVCPTGAIVAPFQLDARRCISYLTIELKGSIPIEFRKAMGNRIYGCDDCQLVCPWNKFAKVTKEQDFFPRHDLDSSTLIELFNWSEQEFYKKLEGSAIRRIGYQAWLRNIAVALGNAPSDNEIIQALNDKLDFPSELVQEHVQWALQQHQL